MTRYCYDTEFLDDGKTIELISIGIVCEDGRTYYAVNSEMPVEHIICDDWMRDNVWRHLPLAEDGGSGLMLLDTTSARLRPKWVIANEVREFLLKDTTFTLDGINNPPELWAYFAAYDHVVLAQLWGKMLHLPPGIPMYTHDIRQEMDRLKIKSTEVPKSTDQHHALADAEWNMTMLQLLLSRGSAL